MLLSLLAADRDLMLPTEGSDTGLMLRAGPGAQDWTEVTAVELDPTGTSHTTKSRPKHTPSPGQSQPD